MRVTLEMFQWARSLLVCAPAWKCPKEESCFYLAKRVIDAWEKQECSAAVARAEAADEVENYATAWVAPAWEWNLPDRDAL